MAEKIIDGFLPGTQGAYGLYNQGDGRILGWVQEAVAEGERLNRSDPSFEKMDKAMDYVLGEQLTSNVPSYVSKVVVNQTKKAIRTHVSSLTDLRPMFGFKTSNPAFSAQGNVLNDLILAWWVNTMADLDLADAVRYSSTCGSADVIVEWNPHQSGGLGDNRLVTRDPRDTLPIRPSRSRSLQDWEGVIIREAHTPNSLKGAYPEYADAIIADAGSTWGNLYTRFRKVINFVTPASTLDGLAAGPRKGSSPIPEVILYRVHLRDRSINISGQPQLMGKPGTNWCYVVNPGEPLYPRGRLVICTERAVLYDGPNPFWHGMYPISRLKLDPWPWLFFGLGLVHDLTPLQNSINTVTNDLLQALSQWVNRGMVADSKAMPETQYKRIDPRKPNWKGRVNATMGEAFKLMDGPNVPAWAFELLKLLVAKHEDLSGVANLQALAQLRQMPSGDTIEKYYNALTPEIRQEGRLLECFLRDIAEMIKVNIFQFYSQARRILVLGEAGRTLQDFDWDPDTMIPAMAPGDDGYVPELDSNIDRDRRAQFFHKLFTFYIAPNSILAMHAQEKKMMYVQLARQGYMDFWSLMEMLEIPNVGEAPAIPLPQRDYDPQKNLDPQSGVPMPPPMEVRVPITITERLQAQQMLGIGQQVNPVGRKASGDQPPQLKTKSDGRTTMSESG